MCGPLLSCCVEEMGEHIRGKEGPTAAPADPSRSCHSLLACCPRIEARPLGLTQCRRRRALPDEPVPTPVRTGPAVRPVRRLQLQ